MLSGGVTTTPSSHTIVFVDERTGIVRVTQDANAPWIPFSEWLVSNESHPTKS